MFADKCSDSQLMTFAFPCFSYGDLAGIPSYIMVKAVPGLSQDVSMRTIDNLIAKNVIKSLWIMILVQHFVINYI